MSAAFEFKDTFCWGTNGMIEGYLEWMAQAAVSSNTEPELADWLSDWRDGFFTGAVVMLDDVLTGRERALQFVRLFEDATTELLNADQYTDYGKQWLREEAPKLTDCIRAAFQPSGNSMSSG